MRLADKLKRDKRLQNKYSDMSKSLADETVKKFEGIYARVLANLQTAAQDYQKEIKHSAAFRAEFYDLCDEMGIDPMMSSKNVWADLGLNDFYNDLSVRILEFCNRRRFMGSGITQFAQIQQYLLKRYTLKVSPKDILKSLSSLKELGTVQIIGRSNVAVVPVDMTDVVGKLMDMAEKNGLMRLTLCKQQGISRQQFFQGVQKLMARGLLWQDSKTGGEPSYYLASMIDYE